jgi:ribosomal protein L35
MLLNTFFRSIKNTKVVGNYSTISNVIVNINRNNSKFVPLNLNSNRLISTTIVNPFLNKGLKNNLLVETKCITSDIIFSSHQLQLVRGIKKLKKNNAPRRLKTKKAVSKRMIETGKGLLKTGHPGMSHLSSGYSKTRKRRLNTRVLLKGVFAKTMKKLVLHGK